jgi:hypothetical protein
MLTNGQKAELKQILQEEYGVVDIPNAVIEEFGERLVAYFDLLAKIEHESGTHQSLKSVLWSYNVINLVRLWKKKSQ